MSGINIAHGHEKQEHQALKAEVTQWHKGIGFDFVLCEKGNSDVIAKRSGNHPLIAVEIERSVRNVRRNICRDISQGCAYVLIICPDFKTAGEIARKIDRELSPALRERVGIMTKSVLRMTAP